MATSLQSKIIAALDGKMPRAACPLCHAQNWAVQPYVYWFQERFRSERVESTGQGLASAALVCTNCGNTQFINLVVFGDEFKEFM
jgi:hypothetical protein